MRVVTCLFYGQGRGVSLPGEISLVQAIESTAEVPQVCHEPVEQTVARVVGVTKILPQQRFQHRTAVQMSDMPAPVIPEEIVHTARVAVDVTQCDFHQCHPHVKLDQFADAHTPHEKDYIVHVPKFISSEYLALQQVEQIAGLSAPTTQERIAHETGVVNHEKLVSLRAPNHPTGTLSSTDTSVDCGSLCAFDHEEFPVVPHIFSMEFPRMTIMEAPDSEDDYNGDVVPDGPDGMRSLD